VVRGKRGERHERLGEKGEMKQKREICLRKELRAEQRKLKKESLKKKLRMRVSETGSRATEIARHVRRSSLGERRKLCWGEPKSDGRRRKKGREAREGGRLWTTSDDRLSKKEA